MRSGSSPPGGLRLAYLVSAYPATSHTFISREVTALRELRRRSRYVQHQASDTG